MKIADYAATAGAQRLSFRSGAGSEPGDPHGAARAIIAVLRQGTHPQRLLLGAPAEDMAIEQLQAMLAEAKEFEELTKSADFSNSQS
jgi:hypothetical protein